MPDPQTTPEPAPEPSEPSIDQRVEEVQRLMHAEVLRLMKTPPQPLVVGEVVDVRAAFPAMAGLELLKADLTPLPFEPGEEREATLDVQFRFTEPFHEIQLTLEVQENAPEEPSEPEDPTPLEEPEPTPP